MLDIPVSDTELERLWQTFHRSWVCVSEDLIRAEQALREEDADDPQLPSQIVLVAVLRSQERRQREMLDRFVDRMRSYQNASAAFRARRF